VFRIGESSVFTLGPRVLLLSLVLISIECRLHEEWDFGFKERSNVEYDGMYYSKKFLRDNMCSKTLFGPNCPEPKSIETETGAKCLSIPLEMHSYNTCSFQGDYCLINASSAASHSFSLNPSKDTLCSVPNSNQQRQKLINQIWQKHAQVHRKPLE
jgi:hypothetical protein